MDEAQKRVNAMAEDARSVDDGIPEQTMEDFMEGPRHESPLDQETLDESHANHMGERWEPTRRGAND